MEALLKTTSKIKIKKIKPSIGNSIHGLIEDSLHNIWIGTGKGLSCYDIKADTFRNFLSLIPGQPIIPFWATKNEIFCWDFAESQLTSYNIHSFKKQTLVKFAPGETDSLRKGLAPQNAIFDAESNSIWMEKGFPGWLGGTGGRTFTRFRLPMEEERNLSGLVIEKFRSILIFLKVCVMT